MTSVLFSQVMRKDVSSGSFIVGVISVAGGDLNWSAKKREKLQKVAANE